MDQWLPFKERGNWEERRKKSETGNKKEIEKNKDKKKKKVLVWPQSLSLNLMSRRWKWSTHDNLYNELKKVEVKELVITYTLLVSRVVQRYY